MLGPPSCEECRVWLNLDDKPKGRGWYCPVCEKDSKNGYKHLSDGQIYDDSVIRFLRFMKGKQNGLD